MKILLFIFIFLLGLTGLSAQDSGWQTAGSNAWQPAINETSGALDVKVFPNPVSDKRVNVELSDQSIHELRITNIAGSVIFSKRFQMPVARYQVFLADVPNGVYLLRVTSDGNQTRTTKLMIRNQ
jgi:hypothetical protein